MAKKASPATAISTTSPLISCLYLLSVMQEDIDADGWNLIQCVRALQQLNAPQFALQQALKGQITSLEEAKLYLITARILK